MMRPSGPGWVSKFRPTPPYRGRRPRRRRRWPNRMFRPTPPYRGRRGRPAHPIWQRRFRPTPPYRGRRGKVVNLRIATSVSTHAPVPGATWPGCGCGAAMMFRPTPPYRGRRSASGRPARPGTVSTHAPVPGATRALDVPERLVAVSTHAPVPGATSSHISPYKNYVNNPISANTAQICNHACATAGHLFTI